MNQVKLVQIGAAAALLLTGVGVSQAARANISGVCPSTIESNCQTANNACPGSEEACALAWAGSYCSGTSSNWWGCTGAGAVTWGTSVSGTSGNLSSGNSVHTYSSDTT